MSLSDRILSANDEVLQEMLAHRFVADIKADHLPRDVFRRYLSYEGAFVETAIAIFAYATARAPNVAAQRWLIGVLDALANTQVPYFEQTCARLGITPPDVLPEPVQAFDGGMHDLARDGSFVDILTAMFAAEWMYWLWCTDAAQGQIADPDLRAWVNLHATPDFEGQARWLKEAIDHYGDPSEAERLSVVFGRVMLLEIDFHAAAYDPPASSERDA